MKKTACLLLTLLMFISCSIFCAHAEEAGLSPWQNAYLDLLNDTREKSDAGGYFKEPFLSYSLYDIDKNSVPELILRIGSSTASALGQVYSFDGSKAFLVEEFGYGGEYLASYPEGNGILFCHARMGEQTMQFRKLSNGELSSEIIFSEGQDNMVLVYTDPGEVVSGSVTLSDFSCNSDYPVLTYNRWASYLDNHWKNSSATTPDAGFPNNDSEYFQKILSGESGIIPVEVYRLFYLCDSDTIEQSLSYPELEQVIAEANDIPYEEMSDCDSNYINKTLITADLNGDGQLEAIYSFKLWLNDHEDLMFTVIFSEQDGKNYAYLLSDSNCDVDESGTLYYYHIDKNSPEFVSEEAFRVLFDERSCMMLYVSLENYSGERSEYESNLADIAANVGRPIPNDDTAYALAKHELLEDFRTSSKSSESSDNLYFLTYSLNKNDFGELVIARDSKDGGKELLGFYAFDGSKMIDLFEADLLGSPSSLSFSSSPRTGYFSLRTSGDEEKGQLAIYRLAKDGFTPRLIELADYVHHEEDTASYTPPPTGWVNVWEQNKLNEASISYTPLLGNLSDSELNSFSFSEVSEMHSWTCFYYVPA